MPGRDGTGPMTGRGLGLCSGVGVGFRHGHGRGMSCRRGGGGFGLGRQNQEPVAAEPTKQALEEQVEYLESLLKGARGNLERVSKAGKTQ